jgi:hypothetical protein
VSRRRGAPLRALLFSCCLAAWLASAPGCAIATITGFATGALTGMIDAPAQVYRHHRGELDRHPEYWTANLIIFMPTGFVAGPFVGLIKGIAIDVQWWFLDHSISYQKVFAGYGEESIWRPFTIHW